MKYLRNESLRSTQLNSSLEPIRSSKETLVEKANISLTENVQNRHQRSRRSNSWDARMEPLFDNSDNMKKIGISSSKPIPRKLPALEIAGAAFKGITVFYSKYRFYVIRFVGSFK